MWLQSKCWLLTTARYCRFTDTGHQSPRSHPRRESTGTDNRHIPSRKAFSYMLFSWLSIVSWSQTPWPIWKLNTSGIKGWRSCLSINVHYFGLMFLVSVSIDGFPQERTQFEVNLCLCVCVCICLILSVSPLKANTSILQTYRYQPAPPFLWTPFFSPQNPTGTPWSWTSGNQFCLLHSAYPLQYPLTADRF